MSAPGTPTPTRPTGGRIPPRGPDDLTHADIIHDWNEVDRLEPVIRHPFRLFDETLRDGIQSPSVHDPSIEDKIRFVHLLDELGVEHVNIGLPGAGPRAVDDATQLALEIRDARLRVRPACAARTHPNDIRPIVEISQQVGLEIEVMAFIGSSPVRLYAEDWDAERMLQLSADAIDLAVAGNLPVTYVTEDTTRSRPKLLATLFRNAIEHGARRLCLCDTVGHATPDGVRNLVHFTRDVVASMDVDVGIDWHGHNDRGLAVINALRALEYGADRVHGTVLGVGERVGNSALDQLIVNLHLLGYLGDRDLSRLLDLCRLVSTACQVPIPYNYPVVGPDAFRTATGVHAAAIIKAERKGDAWLADHIYSGVPAHIFGREQQIEIGHMSGESNVLHWLGRRGYPTDRELVARVYQLAKSVNHLLTEDQILREIERYQRAVAPTHSKNGTP